MNTNAYIKNALRTESTDFNTINMRLLHGAMGLVTEAGEFLDTLKKNIYYKRPIDRINLAEEIGDIFWYLALLCDELGVSFEDVMDTNIKKLKTRYPEKFDSEKAISRDLKKERSVLNEICSSIKENDG